MWRHFALLMAGDRGVGPSLSQGMTCRRVALNSCGIAPILQADSGEGQDWDVWRRPRLRRASARSSRLTSAGHSATRRRAAVSSVLISEIRGFQRRQKIIILDNIREAGVADYRYREHLRDSRERAMTLDPSVREPMLAALPNLRAFAMSLCRNPEQADDLVQDTLLRACEHIEQFQKGTNLIAWMLTIMRNRFLSEYRRRLREVQDADGVYAETLVTPPNQAAVSEYREVDAALKELPYELRETLMLVGVSDLSYGEAAQICGCAVGTIKSRVHRARTRLAAVLSLEATDKFGDEVSYGVAVHAEQARIHLSS